jgi:hypothetical protein
MGAVVCCIVSFSETAKSKVAAQRAKFSAKTKSNGAAPAHTRSEVRRMRGRGRGNVAAEVEKLRT